MGIDLTPAHPRECGADVERDLTVGLLHGSSPRVRGRRHHHAHHLGTLGLIPASAGQTASPRSAFAAGWAHPRECGADGMWCKGNVGGTGSSPRVRGRRGSTGSADPSRGLIPASAGQTLSPACHCVPSWAHPRECGADTSVSRMSSGSLGSSPRVRGRRGVTRPFDRLTGLIPASAGQTLADQRRSADHKG